MLVSKASCFSCPPPPTTSLSLNPFLCLLLLEARDKVPGLDTQPSTREPFLGSKGLDNLICPEDLKELQTSHASPLAQIPFPLQIPMGPAPGSSAPEGQADVPGLHVRTTVEQQSWPQCDISPKGHLPSALPSQAGGQTALRRDAVLGQRLLLCCVARVQPQDIHPPIQSTAATGSTLDLTFCFHRHHSGARLPLPPRWRSTSAFHHHHFVAPLLPLPPPLL